MAVASARPARLRTHRRSTPLPGARAGTLPPADAVLSPLAPRGQLLVAMLSAEEAARQGLVLCTRCDAWHTPEQLPECDRHAFIAWSERRAEAHANDPSY